jgi:hypothetical protein
MKINAKTSLILILVLGILSSCQPIFKVITGVRNPKVYENKADRFDYYKPWFEQSKAKVIINTIADEKSFIGTFQALSDVSFPIFILKDMETNKTYSFDCYDDVEYTQELLSMKQFDKIEIASLSTLNLVDSLSTNFITKENYKRDGELYQDGYEIQIVHGSFLGKKTRKRLTKIFNSLESIKSIRIYDLSVDEDDKIK